MGRHATWTLKMASGRAQESAAAKNSCGNDPAQAPALGDIIESFNVVCSFVEFGGGNPKMLRMVGMLESVTI